MGIPEVGFPMHPRDIPMGSLSASASPHQLLRPLVVAKQELCVVMFTLDPEQECLR